MMAEMINPTMKVFVNGVDITRELVRCAIDTEDDSIKILTKITRNEWIVYAWVDVTSFCDDERVFMRGRKRTPTEAAQAAQDWEVWQQAARNLAKGE